MKARITDGRDFDASDEVPGARTVIIDDQTAKIAFLNESPLGKTLLARPGGPEAQPFTVIGVAKHLRHSTLVGDEKESLYFQSTGGNAWLIKDSGDANALAP